MRYQSIEILRTIAIPYGSGPFRRESVRGDWFFIPTGTAAPMFTFCRELVINSGSMLNEVKDKLSNKSVAFLLNAACFLPRRGIPV